MAIHQNNKINPTAEEKVAKQILRIVKTLCLELHPNLKATLRVGLDSKLGQDLGLDSLSRAELLTQLEHQFDVHLSEQLLAETETVRDWFIAVLQAETGRFPLHALELVAPTLGPAAIAPVEAKTLTEVLDWHANKHASRAHIILWDGTKEKQTISYHELAEKSKSIANGLREWGIESGERAAIVLPTGLDFFTAFFGVLYAGGVPVPLYPVMQLTKIEEHLNRQASILNNAEATILITLSEAKSIGTILKSRVKSLRAVKSVKSLQKTETERLPVITKETQLALLQYTSGSTGDPKGVRLTHANLLANIRAIGKATNVNPTDICISWLPLYHDMGLIGAWLGCLYHAVPTVFLSPLAFLARPASWLWAIHHFHGTLSAAPNFAYGLCVHKIDDKDLKGLDLSSLRILLNGAEKVSANTICQFTERFKPYGFKPKSMTPVYGLAENTLGLCFSLPGQIPIIDRIDRKLLMEKGIAKPVAPDAKDTLEVVGCGQRLIGHQTRIIDFTGHEVGERREGRLQFRGPSATSGYFQNEAKTRELFDGKWLNTGDLAYRVGGDVFITSRDKDIIISAGRNIHPDEVEEVVNKIDGLRKGCICVIGSKDPILGTERVVILAETRITDKKKLSKLREQIIVTTTDILDIPPYEVILAPPHSIPKTSSGKLRRSSARKLFEEKQFGAKTRAVWLQILQLRVDVFISKVQIYLRSIAAFLYAGYWWMLLSLVVAIVWPLAMVLPQDQWRWRVIQTAGKFLIWAWRIKLKVLHKENLPPAGGVFVANHSSYLDGLILILSCPDKLTFIAKKELARQFFAGHFLKKIKTLFVERQEHEDSLKDFKIVLDAAKEKNRLVFFPEGTITRMPGLLGFRLGAFLVATNTGCPVVPITIRGTRDILRDDGQWFPRWGSIEVHVGKPILAKGTDFNAAVRLRDTAREEILTTCGEMDLEQEKI
ncbi:AMP-binding protein [Xanthovirga aplysinae]|uniref:AMP-binding protein n=1 Tax=Xanthovirga aplysinae TaxID=2529853 RepID=UPI0016575ACC|nr:AMP-binding protein [Xanthovirga aplysinae]